MQVKDSTVTLRDVDEEEDQNTDGGTVYKQMLINAKLQIGKRCKKKERTVRSALKRRGFALDCSAICGEEEGVDIRTVCVCVCARARVEGNTKHPI